MKHLLATCLAALSLALPTLAQSATQKPFTDPANLRGERVSPLTGRELPINKGALGLQELLRKLSTRASILNIVAHPDDEDGGMLTLYARGLGARVADLSLTRGEGGQNAMTGDFEDALGLLRTQELLANDRYTGVHQFFGTEVDFGFSKTKAESFAKWGHQRVLYDAVRAIRLFRPLVITSTWTGNVTDGHGQHQVAGEIAQEAFVAAGDPKVFPELTKEGILPWQPLKIYARVPRQAVTSRGLYDYATGQYTPARFTNYVTGKVTDTIPSTDIVVHEGTVDPLLTIAAANHSDLPPTLAAENPTTPLSYVQFARIGLGLQKSQIGPGVRDARSGRFDVPYHLYASNLPPATNTAEAHHNSGWPILSWLHRERVGYRAPRDPTSALSTNALDQSPTLITTAFEAPTARSIPAQGNALGNGRNESQRAESPPYNSALAIQPSFFDGIDTSIEGIASLAPDAKKAVPIFLKANLAGIAQKIESAQNAVSAGHTDYAANDLATALTLTDMFIKNLTELKPDLIPTSERENILHELHIKRVQLNDALVLALGLRMNATAPNSEVVTKTTVPVHITVRADAPNIPYVSEELQTSAGTITRGPMNDGYQAITPSHPWTDTLNANPSLTQNETRPYFFRKNIEQPIYQLHNRALRNAPATPPALTAWVNLTFNGTNLRMGRIVESNKQPIEFVPPASLSVSSHAQVLPNTESTFNLQTALHPLEEPPVHPHLALPSGWKSSVAISGFAAPGQRVFTIHVPSTNRTTSTVKAIANVAQQTITEGYRPVGYGDLPRTNYYTPATDRIVPVDLKLPPPNKRHIGYLPGTGDAVPQALASIGLKPTMLTVSDLTPAKLKSFDTIILGVRTYNAHPDLHGAPTRALLDFARAGGNVLVQYQTGEFTSADAPYPLELGYRAEKVVDETAPVELLHPSSTLLTTPNHISSSDFNHWIEERGHGFLASWDSHYTALTETHDPGQSPQKGGLISVRLGKGRWTYCAFALYRQLPEAVPGAYRLFTNLLAP